MAGSLPLVDRFGRRVSTLRVSLTDHCNFRCVYCMPPEGVSYMPKSSYLSTEGIARVVRITGDMGVTRYRLTGGEPLLRPDVVSIVERLRAIERLHDQAGHACDLPVLVDLSRDTGQTTLPLEIGDELS